MARATLSIPKTEAPAPAADETSAAAPEGAHLVSLAPTLNPRLAVLDSIAASSRIDTESDGAIPLIERSHLEAAPADDLPPEPVPPTINDVAAAEGIAPDTTDTPAPASDAAALAAAEGKKFVVDVKGTKTEVDEAAVLEAGLHALRNKGAAEMALRQASEMLERAKQYQPAAPAPAPARDLAEEARLADMAKKIQMGSTEDAIEVIKQLQGAAQIDPDQVNNLVAEQVRTQVKLVTDQETAAKALETLVPEMLADARVMREIVMEERAARARGDVRPYGELYADIGKNMRAWLDGLKGASAPASGAPAASATIQQRAAAKAATPAAVVGRSASAPAPTTNRPATGSQIIEQMRQARGKRQYT